MSTDFFQSMKKKYHSFASPEAYILVDDNAIASEKNGVVINDLSIELSAGFEASAASFSVYGIFNQDEEAFEYRRVSKWARIGSKVEIALGYSRKRETVFIGYLASISFCKDVPGGHHMEVLALDIKGFMMSALSERQLEARTYGAAVKEILSGNAYGGFLTSGLLGGIRLGRTPDEETLQADTKEKDPIELVNESDYEFIVRVAKRFHYEFFVEKGVVIFRKAKEQTNAREFALSLVDDVDVYRIQYDLTGIAGKVEVRGMDPGRGRMVSASCKNTGKISENGMAKAFLKHQKRVVLDPSVTSELEASYRAKALTEEMAYRYGSMECSLVGIPDLMPGNWISLSGLDAPSDNEFYMTGIRHQMNDISGYKMTIYGSCSTLKQQEARGRSGYGGF